jgi:CheY-like chemotaxis protein
MPGMSGIDVAKEISTSQTTKPVMIAATAGTTSDLHAKCIDVGMKYVLTKPFSFEELCEAIEHYS